MRILGKAIMVSNCRTCYRDQSIGQSGSSYAAITSDLMHKTYLAGFTKSQKFILTRVDMKWFICTVFICIKAGLIYTQGLKHTPGNAAE